MYVKSVNKKLQLLFLSIKLTEKNHHVLYVLVSKLMKKPQKKYFEKILQDSLWSFYNIRERVKKNMLKERKREREMGEKNGFDRIKEERKSLSFFKIFQSADLFSESMVTLF